MGDELNDKVELLLVMKNYINNLNKYIDDCQIALEEKKIKNIALGN